MKLQRVLTKLTVEVQQEGREWLVQVTSRWCESSITSGRIVNEVDRYDHLAIDEVRQLLETLSYQEMPGSPAEEEHQLFILS